MSEVHNAAVALLATPQLGTFLTPEGREMVLRAVDEVETLREAAATAEKDAQLWQRRAMAAEAQIAALRAVLNVSPAGSPTIGQVPPAVPAAEPAGDVLAKEGAGSGPQSPPAVEASSDGQGGADSSLTGGRNPGQPSAGNGADEGQAAASAGVAKWGRADGKGAFHLWRAGFTESECLEECCEGEVLFGDPIPDNSCLSCAAIVGWDVPDVLPDTPQREFSISLDKSQPGGVAIEPVLKKKRNVPEACVIPGCPNKGAARNQWCCPEHAAKLNLQERQAALAAWKRVRKGAPAVEAANV